MLLAVVVACPFCMRARLNMREMFHDFDQLILGDIPVVVVGFFTCSHALFSFSSLRGVVCTCLHLLMCSHFFSISFLWGLLSNFFSFLWMEAEIKVVLLSPGVNVDASVCISSDTH